MATAFDEAFNAGGFGGSEMMPEPAMAPASTPLVPAPQAFQAAPTNLLDLPMMDMGTIDPGPVQAPSSAQTTPPIVPPSNAPENPTLNVHRASQDITQRLGLRAAVTRATGAGAQTRSQEEIDMSTLSFTEQDAKYGHELATRMRLAWGGGQRDLAALTASTPRTGMAAVGDSAIDVGNALTTGLMSLGSLAGSGVDAALGTNIGPWSSRQIESFSDWAQGNQSERLQDRRTLSEIRSSLDQRDNDAQFERERDEVGPATAHARRIGRGIIDGVVNAFSSRETLLSGLSEGVGSLLGAGKVAGGLRLAGRVALSGATGRALVEGTEAAARGGSRPARALLAAAAEAPMVAGIGLMEAGGAFQGTVSEIQNMSFEDLSRTSPEFVSLVQSGISPEDARNQIANRAGRTAAAIQGPLAAATGAATQRLGGAIAGRTLPYLEQAPFRVGSIGSAAGQMIGEFVEEGIQSGTGALSQNVGVAQGADPSRSLTQGVGEQAGAGAILGLGTAGAVQAPGAARAAIGEALGLAGEAVVDAVQGRAERVRERNETASPVSETNVRAQAQTVVQEAVPAVQAAQTEVANNTNLTLEQQTTAQEFIDRVARADALDPRLLEEPGLSDVTRNALQGATGQVDALYRVAKALQASKNEDEQTSLARALLRINQNLDDLMEVDPDTVKGILADDHPLLGVMNRFQDLIPKLNASPVVNRAVGRALNVVGEAQTKVTSPEIDTSINPENKAPTGAAQNTIEQAQRNPSKNSLEAVQRVSYHAAQGNLVLTPAQQQALDNSERILKAAKKASDAAKAAGHTKPTGDIADRVLVEEKGNQIFERSAARHSTDVVTAMAKGDPDLAQDLLEDMGKFVTHMSNKVGAINKHFELGPNAPKQQSESLQADRTFKLAGRWGVTPSSKGSVEFAQQVDLETQMLADVYNDLVEAFPGLNQKKITPTNLASALKGNIETVASDFRKGTRNNQDLQAQEDLVLAENAKLKEQQDAQEAEAKVAPVEGASISPTVESAPGPEGTQESAPAKEPETAPEDLSFEQLEQEISKQQKLLEDMTGTKERAQQEAYIAALEDMRDDKRDLDHSKTVSEVYPNLLGSQDGSKIENVFITAFKLPKKVKSFFLGSGSPLAWVQDALKSDLSFKTISKDSSPSYKIDADVARNYQAFLSAVPGVIKELNTELNSYMSGEQSGRSRYELLADGSLKLNHSPNGMSLNIVEIAPDGSLRYNQELIEGAVLAGFQWMMDNRHGSGKIDAEIAAGILGIREDQVDLDDIAFLNTGTPQQFAKLGLASKISSYWGLNKNKNSSLSEIEGIPESVASQVLQALQRKDLIKIHKQDIKSKRRAPEEGQDILEENTSPTEATPAAQVRSLNMIEVTFLKPHQAQEKNGRPWIPMYDVPNAIDMVTLPNPEKEVFIGQEIPLESEQTHQHRNPMIQNTMAGRAALRKANKSKFFPDVKMVELLESLTEKGFIALFGHGDISKTPLNVNDRISKDGKNRSLSSGYRSVLDHISMLRRMATDERPWHTLETHYAHNMLRNNRMMMLGAFNPQIDKTARDVMLSTWDELDLSGKNEEHLAFFNLAMAQALGIKIHQQSPLYVSQELDRRLTALAPVIDMLQDLGDHISEPESIQRIQAAFSKIGEPVTMLGIHALMERGRYDAMSPADRAFFTSSLYIEADGVTNGVANAMAMFTSGEIKESFIANMAKAGRLYGGDGNKTLADHFAKDSRDLYTTTRDTFKDILLEEVNGFDPNERRTDEKHNLWSHSRSLMKLMDMLLKDFSIVPDEENPGELDVQITRNLLKNPMTMKLYGAGAASIATSLADRLRDEIYARFSAAAQAQAKKQDPAETVFLKEANGDVRMAREIYEDFLDLVTDMTKYRYKEWKDATGATQRAVLRTQVPGKDEQGKRVWKNAFVPDFRGEKFDPLTFTMNPAMNSALDQNVFGFFVSPMVQAIDITLGESVKDNTKLLQMATQAQSIVYQHKFEQAVAEQIKLNKADPDWKSKTGIPSPNQLRDIAVSLRAYAPYIETGEQNYLITKPKNYNSSSKAGMALNEQFSSIAQISGFQDAGVSGLANMTQGLGDGYMIQTAVLDPESPTNVIYIFDGIHYSVGAIGKAGVVANRAAYNSWLNNPLNAVRSSYSPFMATMTMEDLTDGMLLPLTRSFTGNPRAKTPMSREAIFDYMKSIQEAVTNVAEEVNDTQSVFREVQQSIDQMAGPARPYTTSGKKILTGDAKQIAAQLERMREAREKARLAKAKPEAPAPSQDDSPAAVVSTNALFAEIKKHISTFSPAQQAVLTEIRRSMAAKGYTYVYGTAEQIYAYQEKMGYDHVSMVGTNGEIHGATTYGNKVIYVVRSNRNPNETLVHELVHASTFEKIQDYYDGKRTDEVVQAAILNLENQMEQFLSLDPRTSEMSFQDRQAFENAKLAIRSAPTQALALNEFMAWVLANQNLASVTSKVTAGPITRLVQAAMTALKKLIFGRKHLPKPGDDLFSNLLFNSAIIMRSQPSISQMSADTVSYMSTSYGMSGRLAALQEAFDQLFVQYTDTDRVNGLSKPARENARNNSAIIGEQIANRLIANAFPHMTMQEKSLFTSIVAALNADMLRDPTSIAEMEKIYRHVMKNLVSEDIFMVDPDANDPNDRAQANAKLNALRGEYVPEQDLRKRSYLLPVFFGLAATNDQFREVLAKIPMAPGSSSLGSTTDEVVGNVANRAMVGLSNYISGADPNARNAQQAMDALMGTIQKQIQQRQGFIEQFSSPLGSGMDRVNDWGVKSIEYLSDKVQDVAANVKARTKNKTIKWLADSASVTAKLATQDGAEDVAVGIGSLMNRTGKMVTFREMLANVIGRTRENAGVYDRMKIVKTDAQQDRQAFREQVPRHIVGKFSRALQEHEWTTLFNAMGKTDLATVASALGREETLDLLLHRGKVNGKIQTLEAAIQAHDPAHFSLVQAKAKELAHFMNTGMHGDNLLRNARAVSELLGEKKAKNRTSTTAAYITQVDQLISLYALNEISSGDMKVLRNLVRSETQGMDFVLAYLEGQRNEEVSKAQGMAYYNSYKGYVPKEQQAGLSLIVADDREGSFLLEKSYVRVGDYNGSKAERARIPRGYYFAPVNGRAAFDQGIIQTVRPTSGGVDITTGFSHDNLTAGAIQDPSEIGDIIRARSRNNGPKENLRPVFNQAGQIVAFERSIDPAMAAKLNHDTNLARMIGVWRGRQVEEEKAQALNEELINQLQKMYQRDKTARPLSVKDEYVNLFDTGSLDPVLKGAFNLVNKQTREYADNAFGNKGEFWVRRDMLADTLGYHKASVGDVWTGNSRWSPATQKVVKDLAISMFGNKGYQYLTMGEAGIQKLVKEAKTIIVIKSVIVPYANAMSNIFHLISRGVPIRDIVRGMPRKLAEIDFYAKSRIEEVRLEAELRAATDDPFLMKKLQAELTSIKDSQRRLSIWSLIERGEFSSISDAGLTQDDLILTGRNVTDYMDALTEKLPERAKTFGRYALITKDTALFQGLQKSVAYGDFIAKAIFYDDLINRQGKSVDYANGIITEEFVNYDVLPGRTRGYLENMGILWFWNFKVRYSKIALSILRNNPVHALLSTLIPLPQFLSSGVDMGFEGSMFEKLSDGSINRSIGFSQGLNAPLLNPWLNLVK
jgi:hypothetical protein